MDFLILCAAVLCASTFNGDVQAYLDPGTGSMAIQMLLAGVVGVLATIKIYWTRIGRFFGRTSQPKKSLLDD